MYHFIRRLLFCLKPEVAHDFTLKLLKQANQLGLLRFFRNNIASPRLVMGMLFPNPIGLAAGLDKNGEYIDALAALGFGFIEIGTVTPKPQAGNPKPRLFRLPKENAIINRLGFNGKGVEYVVNQLEKTRYRGILGINIGKNRETPNEHAIDDYLIGFRRLWKFASYITINISSPNTQGLRDLQKGESLADLLSTLKQEQKIIAETNHKYVPLVVKISPDVSSEELQEIANTLLEQQIDGVIATNTTIHREGVEEDAFANETGGLSGQPLQARSTRVIKQLHSILLDHIPIIGVGGIMDEQSAQEKITAGASLLQIYTGFIYQGPGLIARLISSLK